MKTKPIHPDFEAMPEVDYTGKLDKPVNYENTLDEIIRGLKNPEVRRRMGDELMNEVFIRAYNYTSMMFAGYNRLAYICMMYADTVKRNLMHRILEDEYPRQYLIGIKICSMDGQGPVTVKSPYMILGAYNADKAINDYKSNVPLTDYYSPHIVAYKEDGGEWQLLSEIVTRDDMRRILSEARQK